jgi:hypothetical protein
MILVGPDGYGFGTAWGWGVASDSGSWQPAGTGGGSGGETMQEDGSVLTLVFFGFGADVRRILVHGRLCDAGRGL